jgi:hypothetical protein
MRKKISAVSLGWSFASAFALASLVLVASPRVAAAQARDPAAAQALFDQGRELSRQGRYAEACPKFLESNRLDPGIGTQFHLAECYQQSGQIATAWATFLDVASIARAANQLDREKAATKRAQQLEPRLPKLTISVSAANQVSGLEVHRDGLLVGAAQWGTPVPVDPGEHELTITAPGRKALSRTLKLEEGKAQSFDVPALQSDGSAAAVAAAPVAAAPLVAPVQTAAPASLPAPEAPLAPAPGAPAAVDKSHDAWPFVLGAVGVAGVAVGSFVALKAQSDNTKSKTDCDAQNVCGATGYGLRNDARSAGNIATAAFIGGAAFIAGAVVVWELESSSNKSAASAPTALRASAAVTPGNAALYLQGSF